MKKLNLEFTPALSTCSALASLIDKIPAFGSLGGGGGGGGGGGLGMGCQWQRLSMKGVK